MIDRRKSLRYQIDFTPEDNTSRVLLTMSHSLKILVISNLYPPQVIGGYERSIADFANLLTQRGHTVMVLTSDSVEIETNCDLASDKTKISRDLFLKGKWSQAKGMSTIPLENHAWINCTNSYTLIQVLREFQPDVCLAGNIDLLGIEVLQIIMASGVPVIHYVMNKIPGFPADLSPPDSNMYRCITCSDWICQTLRDNGYLIESAVVLYPGAIVDEFYQEHLPAHDFLRIAYTSLVMPYKGTDCLDEPLKQFLVKESFYRWYHRSMPFSVKW